MPSFTIHAVLILTFMHKSLHW